MHPADPLKNGFTRFLHSEKPTLQRKYWVGLIIFSSQQKPNHHILSIVNGIETMRPYPSLTLFIFLLFLGLSSSSYVSNHALEPSVGTGRNLLQAKADCPVNFEDQNYTIITSQCKGPKYSPKLCCDAFKKFTCHFVDEINDLKTDCATTMFSYINLYGKYPPGIFANMCKEGSSGLDCKDVDKSQKSRALKTSQSTLLVLSAGFLMLLYNNIF